MKTDTTPSAWVGWLWPDRRSPWRMITEADSWDECTRQTLGLQVEGQQLEVVVLPAGETPRGIAGQENTAGGLFDSPPG